MVSAYSLFARIALSLDDPTLMHTPQVTLLRMLSRAQQWVALRYRLLTQTLALSLVPKGAIYPVASLLPRFIVTLTVARSTGTTLPMVPLERLRFWDAQWLVTPGTPQWCYRIGYAYVGVYPVPTVAEQAHATALVAPAALTQPTQRLEVPDSYVDAVVQVTTGLLLLTAERQYQAGLQMIQAGLGIIAPTTPQSPQPVGAR